MTVIAEMLGVPTEELFAYFETIVETRQREPRDDLVRALLAAEDEGDRLTREELLSILLLIVVAGNETTRNLVGNDSPVQLDGRVVREDLEMGGKRLRAGEKVIALIGAANRDPAAFDNPNAFDIGRNDKGDVSFGRGIHYCLGALLALLEARIASRGLLHRFPSVRLAAEPRYRDGIVLCGVDSLWIEVEQARQPAGT